MVKAPSDTPATRTLLLVEDENDVLAPLAQALASLVPGSRVIPVQSSGEALQVLSGQTVDVVITDLSMPGASGAELVAWVTDNLPHLPCIIMTAYAGAELPDVRALAPDALLVRKPFDPRDLAAKIVQLIARGQAIRNATRGG